MHAEMTPLAAYARWLPKKLHVLDQSLAKIENGASLVAPLPFCAPRTPDRPCTRYRAASYNLRIRGAEYKDSPAMLQALARREADSGGAGAGGRDEVAA